ncbi:glucokinase [Prochlorothrix hollandica]|uniref:Glucokinase n=1 Tax=Prochlorothrix hollandica PCC 9006 = CALU 1027 TaxID=317619 RepID=A0A0M2PU05_PROHO|nr:glucokinase [Prochlorothrix hollandica]KKI99599.1 glucokinase [Prochlorothrix hollandica PCC 9006 = CALU 1027]
MQIIAGDVGGTKTILHLVDVPERPPTFGEEPFRLHTLHQGTYTSAHYPDLAPIVTQFLGEARSAGWKIQAEGACFAIAGPVIHNTCRLTNLDWSLTGNRLAQDLQVPSVELINDFAAVGYGVLGLGEGDLCTLQVGDRDTTAPIAVLGAGTGLGEAFLIRQKAESGDQYQVFASEGGHTSFAPRSTLEFELLQNIQDRHQVERVSVERVVSGQGVVAIYQFLRDCYKRPEDALVAGVLRQWEQEPPTAKTLDPAATIAQSADRDPLCQETLELFITAYGAEAGDMALKLLPYGGLYVAGGIAAKNLALMRSGLFMDAFQAKGRVSGMLDRVPVQIVLNPEVGLIGAALYGSRLTLSRSGQ